jgi:hypothetical protein
MDEMEQAAPAAKPVSRAKKAVENVQVAEDVSDDIPF